ncbi:hypothetical protein ABVK25_004440 [Lepraria finkii]|uniref:Altered inheritance of mitochondria protein 11 n=1 Tax=Lepraria finkii TaxID=1340010 RepID=A0ABR4BB59_9LECA
MDFLQRPSLSRMSNSDAPQPAPQTPAPEPSRSITSPRSRKQLTLFLAGASFLTISGLITRRQLARRHLSTIPRFYHPSTRPPTTPVSGAFEAFEALNLATINVTSFMMMITGGLLWAFDISSLEDIRSKVRGDWGVDGSGRTEGDVEEEFEEWVAGILKRKEDKEKRRRDGEGGKMQRRIREAEEDGEEREEVEERFVVAEERFRNEKGKPR